jgi:3-dehydroquinate dehydratase II
MGGHASLAFAFMDTSKPVFILNGPNLNCLGLREPAVYGSTTLQDIAADCQRTADALEIAIDFRQTNYEGELVTWVQEAAESASGVILNAAAYTHTSVALHDALKMLPCPMIEVHLSNIHKREAFRQTSYVSSVADGIICGLGAKGYTLALVALKQGATR